MKDPCRYLGEQTGLRQCATCCGHVMEKVFACRHPHHDETTLRACRACEDRWTSDSAPAVTTWAVGVTTAPRRMPTLQRCLDSMADAGWNDPSIFAEPETPIPERFAGLTITRRAQVLGAFPNWYLALAELFMVTPHADAYFLCQDDVMLSAGLRSYLEGSLWPSPDVGVVSVFCPAHYGRDQPVGFHAENHGAGTWGALAYVIPNPSVREFLTHSAGPAHRHHGPGGGLVYIDGLVGHWCREVDRPYYVHVPSLAQHIGDTSTLWSAPNLGKRRALVFEEDAQTLTTRPRATTSRTEENT